MSGPCGSDVNEREKKRGNNQLIEYCWPFDETAGKIDPLSFFGPKNKKPILMKLILCVHCAGWVSHHY